MVLYPIKRPEVLEQPPNRMMLYPTTHPDGLEQPPNGMMTYNSHHSRPTKKHQISYEFCLYRQMPHFPPAKAIGLTLMPEGVSISISLIVG